MKLRLKKDYSLNMSTLKAEEVFIVVEVYGGQEIELAEFTTYPEAEQGFETITDFYKNKPNKITINEVSI